MRFCIWIALATTVSVQHCAGQPGERASLVHLQIPNIEVSNQNGEPVHFSSDVLKDRLAVINTVFTTCTTICPIMGAHYARLAQMLGNRLEQDVVLVSISVDPQNDTPAQLKAWSARLYTGSGWTLVTGAKPRIDQLLKSLGLFSLSPQDHQSTILIGSMTSGWTRASALAPPESWLRIIDSFGRHTRVLPSFSGSGPSLLDLCSRQHFPRGFCDATNQR